ncbi:DUF2141 domain-containing protein [Myxacorys almedinensis A]|uniref:DUF2141 domain-containing protein n=2 Tax=Myxacorys TaxID=2056239 RepID=A0A8J7Z6F3_9CYAN|nr:DUF2141 domain-containing protein [Myxacorys almedinensis A]
MVKLLQGGAAWLTVLGSLVGATVIGASQAQAETTRLKVEIDGLRSQQGQVCFSIFANSQGFPTKTAQAVRNQCVKITNRPFQVEFQNLKPGSYAIAVLHDADGNSQANRNALGIPTEGFGFSKNPAIRLGAPSFSETAFQVSGTTTKIQIRLNYLLGG